MTTSRSLSARLDRLSARERRVLAAGAVASALIVTTALVLLPFAARWRARESTISAKADQVARLERLVAREEELSRGAAALRGVRAARAQVLLEGTSVALAGSSLQSIVRRYGEQSRVSLLRLEPARTVSSIGVSADGSQGGSRGADGGGATSSPNGAGAGGELAGVALSVTARGDIHGLVDLLHYLQNGPRLLLVDELRVNAPGGLQADGLLTWTLRVEGFFDAAEDAA